MKNIIFISDLHISEDQPNLTHLFLQFLDSDFTDVEALYILGDLFAFWVGDDGCFNDCQKIKAAMKKLSIPVYLMPGNRDFMMGKSFAAECGATLFSDPHVIDLYGVPTLLSHGDILCANDYFQRIFRYCTKGALVRNLFLKFSLKFRMRLVNFIRKFSVYNNQRKSVQLMDVNQKTTCSMMQRYNAKLIIHGHTHKPGISRVKGNDNLTRISLPNWTEKKGEALKYYADGTYKFVEIR